MPIPKSMDLTTYHPVSSFYEDICTFKRINELLADGIPPGCRRHCPLRHRNLPAVQVRTLCTRGGFSPPELANYHGNLGNFSAVGSYRPNPWGFYDMHGNLWELVADYWGAYSEGPQIDPEGPSP